MAVCTACGLILNNEDVSKHACNPASVPAKGKAEKPTTTEVNI